MTVAISWQPRVVSILHGEECGNSGGRCAFSLRRLPMFHTFAPQAECLPLLRELLRIVQIWSTGSVVNRTVLFPCGRCHGWLRQYVGRL